MNEKQGFVLWFTGLPCSGKTTLSAAVAQKLLSEGYKVERLDGDTFRKKFSANLGFSKADREKNIERAATMASSLAKNGVIGVVSFISPYRQMRENARRQIKNFIEIYVRCPIEVCEKRDVKGMYVLARQGKVSEFTGVSHPYEEPLQPEITVDTDQMDLATCVIKILDYLDANKLVTRKKAAAS